MSEALTIEAPPATAETDALDVPTPSVPPRRRRLRRPVLRVRRTRTVLGLVGLALLGIVLLIAFTGSTHKRNAARSGSTRASGAPAASIPPVNAPAAAAGGSAPSAHGKQPPVLGSPIGSGTPAPPVSRSPSLPTTPPASTPTSPSEGSSANATAPATTHSATTPAPAPAPTPTPAMHTYTTYAAGLLFATSATHLRVVKSAPRFATFPAARHPVVTFLGLAADGRTAQFLLYGRPRSVGDGSCRPSPDACVFLSMRPGDRELITIARADGGTAQYGLGYTSVTRGRARASSPPDAAVSAAGQWLIDMVAGRALPQLASLKYSASGLLLTHLTLPKPAA